MQSNNPVFARSEGFNGRSSTPTYPGAGAYTDPSTWGTGGPSGGGASTGVQERMTIDTVVQKTAITLAVVVAVAAATWVFLPTDYYTMAWMGGAFAGLGLGLFIAFKKVVSPALVLAYAAVEGLFLGAMSATFEALWDGVVPGAVMGTTAAFVATLAAYKFFNIQVTPKFRKFVTIAMFGFVAIVLLDFVLSFFGAAIGFNNFGTLGLIMSFVGLGLGILMLILDFDFVERGVAAGLPEVESWRAAFGLTVTLIWIYIEMLRILAILRGD